MVFKAINSLVKPKKSLSASPNTQKSPIQQPISGVKVNGFQIIDPSKSNGYKSSADLFSRGALDFINANAAGDARYTEGQLLSAYMSSVYLYAALRRVSNLISRVKIVGEIQNGERWVRLPENHRLNVMFAKEGGDLLSRVWLNHAVYGAAVIYKVKTRRALLEEQAENPIYDYKDGAVAGLLPLDKPLWEIDEYPEKGGVRGLFVNQYDVDDDALGNRNYLDRKEFIYITDWNPENPNRGKSMVSVCIHEAVANASIAQWMAEYFTRGAMPFVMVSMAEDDPAMMTDSDLRKYKKQFEEYWSGVGSSLRSAFFDRKVQVETVGIPANEVGAPELNETALEGIAATIGLDRELIVTPTGGSQERHALLVKRAWEDTVIPLSEKYVNAIRRDLGLPPNIRLAVDLSAVSELEAEREEKASSEIGIYESQMQSYNEVRTRLQMPPIAELEGWYNLDGKPVPLEKIIQIGNLPPEPLQSYAMSLWDGNLAKRSEVLRILGTELPPGERDGYKNEIEEYKDTIIDFWQSNLLTKSQVLDYLGLPKPSTEDWEDGYISEIEKSSEFADHIVSLWGDNLLTRSQVIQLLDLGVSMPEGALDGYAKEIEELKDDILSMWKDNLLTRGQVLSMLGVSEPPMGMLDGYSDEIEAQISAKESEKEDKNSQLMDLWRNNLITRSQILSSLGVQMPSDAVDGYLDEVETISEALSEAKAEQLVSSGTEETARSIMKKPYRYDNYTASELANEVYGTGDQADILDDEGEEAWLELIGDDDEAVAAAEEDYFTDYGDYDFDPIEPFYGDMVDILPSESLPETDIYWANNNDNIVDYDPYLDVGEEDILSRNYLLNDTDDDGSVDDTLYYQPQDYDNNYLPINDIQGSYLSDDTVVDIDPYSFRHPMSPFSTQTPTYTYVEQKPLTYDENSKENNLVEDPIFVALWIGADIRMVETQKELRAAFDDYGYSAVYFDPETFHVKIGLAYGCSEDTLQRVRETLKTSPIIHKIETSSLVVIPNGEKSIVAVEVVKDIILETMHNRVITILQGAGTALSSQYYVDNYLPHIPLAEIDSNVPVPYIGEVDFVFVGLPVYVGRNTDEMSDDIGEDDVKNIMKSYSLSKKGIIAKYQDGESDQLKSEDKKIRNKARQENASKELSAWQRAANNKGIKKALRFESLHINENLAKSIKEKLASIQEGDSAAINSVFAQAQIEIERGFGDRRDTEESEGAT